MTFVTTHVDVLIVGAGISGIGAACHLEREQPGKTYAIVEARDAIGGTWDLFRYPGIRSDSDLHTFGYDFKPWTSATAIADGASIKAYVEETADEYDVKRRIRLGHRVLRAEWSSDTALWTVQVERVADGERFAMTARWMFNAAGYYRYDEGYTPPLEGIERFGGTVVHPQHWPEDLDYAGKRVVVIGSGATAVTLVPAMARDAAHVTMLQRSPTYIVPLPKRDPLARPLLRLLGEERGYRAIRRKNIARQRISWVLSKRYPNFVRRLFRSMNEKALKGSGVDVDVHFNPRYNPWDQRLCVVPDGDLFKALRRGTASVVTDAIATFTETGIELASGEHLEADVVVTATGLNLLAFGGVEMSVDGELVSLPEKVSYKSMMLSDVPNFVFAIGYTNASWTLKVDLVGRYFCRILGYLDAHGHDAFIPALGNSAMPRKPLIEFTSGYIQRSLDQMPKQGDVEPWFLAQNYYKDARYLRDGDVTDSAMRFFSASAAQDRPKLSVAA
jgi:monooxygenase